MQISQEAGQVVWYSHLFKDFPEFVVIHTVEDFGIVKAEVDVFVGLFYFFDDPMNVGSLISGSSVFSKSRLYIWKFLVHVLLKLILKDFEYNLFSMQLFGSLNILWHSASLALEWKLTFSNPVTTVEFSKFVDILNAIF